jgi:GT2 family glycosyltransferase
MDRACLAQMVASIEYDPTAGIVAPKILMFDSPELMNEAGNTMHYTGLYRSRGLGAPATDFSISEPIATMSGCCFLIRRDLWMKLEGFSEDFDQFDTGWHACFEDVDLAWRAQLAGFKVMFCPQALMFHKYESKGMVSQRFCGHEWGRYLVFLRNYEFKTLFLLFPLMVILELGTWFYAIGKGRPWLMAKVRVMGWFATNMTHLNRMRERVQRTRRVQDIAIVRQMSHTIPVTHVMKSTGLTRTMQRAMDILFEKYYYFLLGSLTVLHRFDQGATDDCKVGQSRG